MGLAVGLLLEVEGRRLRIDADQARSDVVKHR